MLHKIAFLHLSVKVSCFSAKYDQSQSAFFYGTEEVLFR